MKMMVSKIKTDISRRGAVKCLDHMANIPSLSELEASCQK